MADVWFRFYNSARNSRKVSGLSPICFRCWVLLLTIASEKSGDIPKDFDDLAFELRMEPKRVRLAVQILLDVGLLLDCETCFRTPDWDERQFKSDSSRDRVRAFRERHRNVTVTAQESESDTEKKKETTVLRTVSKKAKPRSQIGDFKPDQAAQEKALEHWRLKGRSDIDLKEQLEWFGEHHLKVGSTMANWPAAWGTWYREAPNRNRQDRHGRSRADRPSAHDKFFEGARQLLDGE